MNTHTIILLSYICLINCIAFIAFAVDKQRAIRSKRRIPERTLFMLMWLGGGFGSLLGMLFAHHKTKKAIFWISSILSCLVFVVIWYLLFKAVA